MLHIQVRSGFEKSSNAISAPAGIRLKDAARVEISSLPRAGSSPRSRLPLLISMQRCHQCGCGDLAANSQVL